MFLSLILLVLCVPLFHFFFWQNSKKWKIWWMINEVTSSDLTFYILLYLYGRKKLLYFCFTASSHLFLTASTVYYATLFLFPISHRPTFGTDSFSLTFCFQLFFDRFACLLFCSPHYFVLLLVWTEHHIYSPDSFKMSIIACSIHIIMCYVLVKYIQRTFFASSHYETLLFGNKSLNVKS